MVSAITAILLVVTPASGAGVRIEINSYGLGKRYAVVVTQAALDKAPAWKAEADDPPLPARKAMKLAGATKDRLVQDTKDWVWRQASAALEESTDGRWYWLVSYEARPRDGLLSGVAPYLRLVVLMDGTVVKPKVSDDRPR
jgi:hypothetical protein